MQGKNAESLDMYQKSLSIRIELLGERHQHVAHVHNYIGNWYRKQKMLDLAKRSFNTALSIQEEVFGLWHPEVARTIHNLASVYLTENQVEQAIAMYERALEIRLKVFGSNTFHPELGSSYNGLGNVYELAKNYEKAEYYYKLALEHNTHAFYRSPEAHDPSDPATHKRKRSSSANSNTALSQPPPHVAGTAQSGGTYTIQVHPSVALNRVKLGLVSMRLNKWQQAETYLHQALQDHTACFGATSSKAQFVLERVHQMYVKWAKSLAQSSDLSKDAKVRERVVSLLNKAIKFSPNAKSTRAANTELQRVQALANPATPTELSASGGARSRSKQQAPGAAATGAEPTAPPQERTAPGAAIEHNTPSLVRSLLEPYRQAISVLAVVLLCIIINWILRLLW